MDLKKNKVSLAILLFVISIWTIHSFKPPLLYNKDGSFKTFGFMSKSKTVIPIWFVVVVLAIFSYLFVFQMVK